jgi:hypothetical protein
LAAFVIGLTAKVRIHLETESNTQISVLGIDIGRRPVGRSWRVGRRMAIQGTSKMANVFERGMPPNALA